jgi:hypothetical protein
VDRILFVDVVQQPFLERLLVPALRQGYPWRSLVLAPFLAYRATVSSPLGSGVAAQQGAARGSRRDWRLDRGAAAGREAGADSGSRAAVGLAAGLRLGDSRLACMAILGRSGVCDENNKPTMPANFYPRACKRDGSIEIGCFLQLVLDGVLRLPLCRFGTHDDWNIAMPERGRLNPDPRSNHGRHPQRGREGQPRLHPGLSIITTSPPSRQARCG